MSDLLDRIGRYAHEEWQRHARGDLSADTGVELAVGKTSTGAVRQL